jgi:hypothetical protein
LPAGTKHEFEQPNGAIKPEWKSSEKDIIGCGISLHSNGKLFIFFTLNGILMGQFLLQLLALMAQKNWKKTRNFGDGRINVPIYRQTNPDHAFSGSPLSNCSHGRCGYGGKFWSRSGQTIQIPHWQMPGQPGVMSI